MITPEKKIWARLIFNPYEENLLKRTFGNFYLTGEVPAVNPDHSLVITPNHFSWWDGFFIDFASRKLIRKNFHIIMLEEQLRRYGFFRKVGAYSINPGSVKGISESFSYTAELLSNPENMLVFYPQGEIEQFDKDPLTVKPGLFRLLQGKSNTDILPAAFRIQYDNRKKPDVYLRFGSMIAAQDIAADPENFSKLFNENLKCLNNEAAVNSFKINLFKSE